MQLWCASKMFTVQLSGARNLKSVISVTSFKCNHVIKTGKVNIMKWFIETINPGQTESLITILSYCPNMLFHELSSMRQTHFVWAFRAKLGLFGADHWSQYLSRDSKSDILQHYTVFLHLCSELHAVFMRQSCPYSSISNDTPDFYSHTDTHTLKDRGPAEPVNRGRMTAPIAFWQSRPWDMSLFFLEWKNRSDT